MRVRELSNATAISSDQWFGREEPKSPTSPTDGKYK
jgi:hypothetical protein